MSNVTSHDVARHCGVSQMTVSRVFTGKGPVAEKTRQRVLDAARQLGYRPNWLASGLGGGATRSIGLIIKGLGVPTAARHICALIHSAMQADYLAYAMNIDQLGDDSQALLRIARDMLSRQVDGLVIYRNMPVSPTATQFLERCGVPVVYVGDWGPPRSPHRIVLDVKASIEQVVAHLAGLGHRRVVYFPSIGLADFPEHKLRPFQRTFARAGIELVMDPAWWIDGGQAQVAPVTCQAVRSFLASPLSKGVSAMVVINDIGAIGAIRALREAGLRVPQDMSVVGFDDMDGAQCHEPSLTTVRWPDGSAVGQAAFEMLQAMIDEPGRPMSRRHFPFELIVRESTGPAPLGRRVAGASASTVARSDRSA